MPQAQSTHFALSGLDDDVCFSSADVLDSMARFSVQGIFNYSMLTLSDLERVLYVGAREALFALDPNDISKQLRQQVTHSHRGSTAMSQAVPFIHVFCVTVARRSTRGLH